MIPSFEYNQFPLEATARQGASQETSLLVFAVRPQQVKKANIRNTMLIPHNDHAAHNNGGIRDRTQL